jgi:hypothetical protein
VNYQKASLLPLLMRFSIRYIIGSYIASIITPRAVLIGGGEAILKCVIQLPISRLAPSYFYLRPVCNKRAIQRSSFGPQSIIELAIEKGRNATSQGNSFVLVSFLLDAFLPLSRVVINHFSAPEPQKARILRVCRSVHQIAAACAKRIRCATIQIDISRPLFE